MNFIYSQMQNLDNQMMQIAQQEQSQPQRSSFGTSNMAGKSGGDFFNVNANTGFNFGT
jgi:hypothetical protein